MLLLCTLQRGAQAHLAARPVCRPVPLAQSPPPGGIDACVRSAAITHSCRLSIIIAAMADLEEGEIEEGELEGELGPGKRGLKAMDDTLSRTASHAAAPMARRSSLQHTSAAIAALSQFQEPRLSPKNPHPLRRHPPSARRPRSSCWRRATTAGKPPPPPAGGLDARSLRCWATHGLLLLDTSHTHISECRAPYFADPLDGYGWCGRLPAGRGKKKKKKSGAGFVDVYGQGVSW